MKELLSLAFAFTMAFASVTPVMANEAPVQTQATDVSDLKAGSMETLKGNENVFYALSLLANGANEEQMKEIEATTLKKQEEKVLNERLSTANEVEKLILLVEGLGYDATAYYLNGETVNLFDMLESKEIVLTNDITFALEAMHSANYTPASDSRLQKDALITKLISMRNSTDFGWSWNGSYNPDNFEMSDADTTAMVLSSLAVYANNPAEVTGISVETKAAVDAATKEGLNYLANAQKESGAVDSFGENASSTAVTILTLSAYGKDVKTDTQFIKNGKTLLDGLVKFKSDDNKGFLAVDWQTGNLVLNIEFATEQGLRALIAVEQAKAGTPYYFYQAGAIANQNRFKQEAPVEPEKPTEVPNETPVVQPGKPEKDEPIKNTGSQADSVMMLCIIAGAGAWMLRKYA